MIGTLRKKAYDYIKQSLVSGKWAGNEYIYPSKVAREIGISYTPVREAIFQLVAEGLLTQAPNSNACVHMPGVNELRELFEVREMLEVGAIKHVVIRAATEQLQKLQALIREHASLLRRMIKPSRSDDGDEILHKIGIIDFQFHLNLMAAAGNGKLLKIMGDLHMLTRIFEHTSFSSTPPEVRHLIRIYGYHSRILKAIVKRDCSLACRWMKKHILWAKEYHLAICERQNNDDILGSVIPESLM